MRRCFPTLILAVALMSTVALAAGKGETIRRGEMVKTKKKVTLAEALAEPARFASEPVLVTGVVRSSCSRKGCWMQLAASPDAEETVRVTFRNYAFFIPLDARGMEARAVGVVQVRKLEAAEVDHLVEEGALIRRDDDGTATEISFVASGVELTRRSK
jgi:hypothetical protein